MNVFFFSSRRRHTRYIGDWSSDVCSSDLAIRARHNCHNVHPTLSLKNRILKIIHRKSLANGGKAESRSQESEARIIGGKPRSEERRVGKECRSRESADHLKKETG